MTSVNFCYWLQGYFEVSNADNQGVSMTDNQVQMIQNHLNLVFKHEIDPQMGDEKHQTALNQIHSTKLPEEPEDKPHPDYKWSSIHGWYDPKEGIPRC